MNSNQEAKVSMYLKVQQFLTEKLTVLTALFSIITTYKTSLDDLIAAIFEADALATADTTGYTEAKQTLRDEMTTLALRISGGGAAYYKLLGDSGSQNEIFFNPSEFTRAHDTVAYTMAMQVFRLANAAGAGGAALAPHGITTTDVSNLNLKAQQYLAILELPKRKVSAKGAQGKKVDALMRDTDDLLYENLDPQMRVLQGTADQELLDEYNGNRGIDDAPTSSSTTQLIVEGDAGPALVTHIPLGDINPTPASQVIFETTGTLKYYFAANAGDAPGGTFYERSDDTTTISMAEFAILLGYEEGVKTKLNVQNTTGSTAHYKLTFTQLQP